MTVSQLQDMHPSFVRLYNAANREGLLSLYRSDALFMAQPGQPATGLDAIGAALDAFLALKGKMQMRTLYLVEAGDVALASAHWALQGTAPDGKLVALEGRSVEVMRRDPGGAWRYAIDHPFGAG